MGIDEQMEKGDEERDKKSNCLTDIRGYQSRPYCVLAVYPRDRRASLEFPPHTHVP